jgi:hypothetical protein
MPKQRPLRQHDYEQFGDMLKLLDAAIAEKKEELDLIVRRIYSGLDYESLVLVVPVEKDFPPSAEEGRMNAAIQRELDRRTAERRNMN